MRFLLRQVRRLVEGAGLIAAFLLGSIAYTHTRMRLRFHASMQEGAPVGPHRQPPAPEKRSMAEIFGALKEVPFNPRWPSGAWKALTGNSFLLFMNAARATSGVAYPYPQEFEEVVIESFDGTPITAAVGIHRDGKRRPAIVMTHGFMGSKHDHYIIDPMLVAYAEWGFNVLGVDLRNFGRSQKLSHSPTTAGWKEAEDLLAAAKYMSEQPEVSSVGITGVSMGAGSTMRAAFAAKDYPYLTGGAIAWNGYADSGRMIEYISTRPQVGHMFFPVYLAFRLMHRIRREDMKGYIGDPEQRKYLDGTFADADFMTYIDRIAAPHYGVSTEEFYRNSSPREFLSDVRVPLLVVHAEDDPVCPASEMDELEVAVRDNPNVDLWMLPTGSHCLFPYLDREWYDTVMREFFTYWATWE
jgi:predicted alpha/beta-fold hydrolase